MTRFVNVGFCHMVAGSLGSEHCGRVVDSLSSTAAISHLIAALRSQERDSAGAGAVQQRRHHRQPLPGPLVDINAQRRGPQRLLR